MPTKKFHGAYDESGYLYPNIRVDYIVDCYYEWVNYTTPTTLSEFNSSNKYQDAKTSSFKWYSGDDNLRNYREALEREILGK